MKISQTISLQIKNHQIKQQLKIIETMYITSEAFK